MAFITYLDENDFKKKEAALREYFNNCYHYLTYTVIPTLRRDNKKEGLYELELPAGDLFTKVYGPMKLKFSVVKDVAVLEDIEPSEYLLTCFSKAMPIYNGIPYDTKKDLFKIKMLGGLM